MRAQHERYALLPIRQRGIDDACAGVGMPVNRFSTEQGGLADSAGLGLDAAENAGDRGGTRAMRQRQPRRRH